MNPISDRFRSATRQRRRRYPKPLESLRNEARGVGLDILQTPQGLSVAAVEDDGQALLPEQVTGELRKVLEAQGKNITAKLREINRKAGKDQLSFASWVQEYNTRVADNAVGSLMDDLAEEYEWHEGLSSWIGDMRADLIENFQMFLPQQGPGRHGDTDGAGEALCSQRHG